MAKTSKSADCIAEVAPELSGMELSSSLVDLTCNREDLHDCEEVLLRVIHAARNDINLLKLIQSCFDEMEECIALIPEWRELGRFGN